MTKQWKHGTSISSTNFSNAFWKHCMERQIKIREIKYKISVSPQSKQLASIPKSCWLTSIRKTKWNSKEYLPRIFIKSLFYPQLTWPRNSTPCNLLMLSEMTVLPRVSSVALTVHAKFWCISSFLLTLSQKIPFLFRHAPVTQLCYLWSVLSVFIE